MIMISCSPGVDRSAFSVGCLRSFFDGKILLRRLVTESAAASLRSSTPMLARRARLRRTSSSTTCVQRHVLVTRFFIGVVSSIQLPRLERHDTVHPVSGEHDLQVLVNQRSQVQLYISVIVHCLTALRRHPSGRGVWVCTSVGEVYGDVRPATGVHRGLAGPRTSTLQPEEPWSTISTRHNLLFT